MTGRKRLLALTLVSLRGVFLLRVLAVFLSMILLSQLESYFSLNEAHWRIVSLRRYDQFDSDDKDLKC